MRKNARRVSESERLSERYFACWTCALAPDALDDYSSALELAHRIVAEDRDNQKLLISLGALQVRAGRYSDALAIFGEASGSEVNRTSSDTYLAYFQAMTNYYLDRPDEFRKSLDEANKLAERELNDAEHTSWNRRLTLERLRKEAEQLISEELPKD